MPGGSYLDTSFLWKLYVVEERSNEAVAWFNVYSGDVFVSELSDVEMATSLHRRFLNFEANEIYADYLNDRNVGSLKWLNVNASVYALAVERAKKYSGRFGLRSLDTIQLAIALHYEAEEMATYDDRLALAARAAGLKLSL